MQDPRSIRAFLLGLSLSILVLFSFFLGAVADRVFVIKPLDFITGKRTGLLAKISSTVGLSNTDSQLSLSQGQTYSVADIAQESSNSIVTISIKKQQRVLNPFASSIFGAGLGVPTEELKEVKQDIGTGFSVDSSGLIVTNKHVVADLEAQYAVIDKNDQEFSVSNIYRDPSNDLAILKVHTTALPAVELGDSDGLQVGEPAIVIGTALGKFRHTVTTGVISGLGRGVQAIESLQTSIESLENVIQTDAAINPGNSGGPLLNAQGQVVGVTVAVTAGAQNIGFAIPINVVKASIENFNKTGQFDRPTFGVTYQTITSQSAELNKVPQGALIVSIADGSIAQRAGLQVNDIITNFDGVIVDSKTNLGELLNKKKIGDTVELNVWRVGQDVTVKVVL